MKLPPIINYLSKRKIKTLMTHQFLQLTEKSKMHKNKMNNHIKSQIKKINNNNSITTNK